MKTEAAVTHLMNNYSRWPIHLVKGKGNKVWDKDGKEYLDFTSGIGVNSLGHVHDAVTRQLHQQLDTLWHCSNLVHVPQQEQLAEKLAQLSGLDRVFFCNSGAEANEAMIKIARRYAQKVKQENRFEVITFQQSFHGRTLATLTATGQEKVKDGFAPLPEGFITVPYNDIEAVRSVLSDRTCAVMLELVQGEGGVHPADPEWVKQLRQLCDQQGILLLVDEIQTGIGRTGSWFCYQQYGIKPDVISMAKALGNGFPIGAIAASETVAQAFSPGTHGTTFGGNPLAVTAGLATLTAMEQENAIAKVKELHQLIIERLQALQAAVPDLVPAIRGKGLMLGIQLTVPVDAILAEARNKGLLLLQAGPQVIRLLPSFITTKAEIDQMAEILEEVILGANG
ncbi:aspartate aminotransferase family protein [Brevibacillus fulvus]|uniref:Acetylornithine aminotransferase n=1 Tax=Brevibacillus fulvus TaxID=1125967 RepID=A0A939BQC3_9BACL|nr:aspartate aminotransferase family protein [Brevibacillus fulvus]MBM7591465.1 acetylornithine aminotransferase [Brevibacillus fulvus]